MPEGLRPRDLIESASDLLHASKGRPRQTNLRRAISTAYYAMFHALAGCCADLFIGGPGSVRSRGAWHQAYRALDHGFAKNACQNQAKIALFPQAIQDFANGFVSLQAKRHLADYDPREVFYKSDTALQIDIVEFLIEEFQRTPLKDRRAFAAHVLLKARIQ